MSRPPAVPALPPLHESTNFKDASDLVLAYLQDQVPMGFWTVSRVIGGRQVYLDVTANEFGLAVGDGPQWEESVCHAMWVGGGPRVAPDLARVPEYAANEAARGLGVASYVGIPMFDAEGDLFGTVCGIDTSVRSEAFAELQPQLELLGHLLSVVRNLDEQATTLTRRLEATAREAETDTLTGLRNRRAWLRTCATEESRHHRLGDHASVVVLDLNGLKQVNDEQGHGAGDAMLQRAARVIEQSVRATDLVARLGGDEFAVFCPQTSHDLAQEVAARVRSALVANGLSAAIGTSTMEQADTITETEARADAAMYADKRRSRS